MACPLFLPSAPLGDLNDFYNGECAAEPAAAIPPDTLQRCCNTGYARGVCARAGQSDADAFRFLIKAAERGTVEVAWSIERNHHPLAVGTSVITEMTARSDKPLERQARAYASSLMLLRP
jgi:hypothetical protein